MAWNRTSEDAAGRRVSVDTTSSSRYKWYLVALIVVLGAAIAAWIALSGDGDAAATGKGTRHTAHGAAIPEATPSAAPKAKAKAEAEAEAVAEKRGEDAFPEKWDDSFATNHALRLHFSKVISARTNAFGLITERYVMPNGQTWRIVRDPPPPFDNLCDNTIAMALSVRAGAPIPPVPGLDSANLDKEFANSMASPIKILDTDSPGRVAMKMAVKGAKEEIVKMIKAGDTRSVGEILRDYIDSNNHAVSMQAEALRAAEKIRQESGDEQAELYLEKVNERLTSFGVEPVKRQTRNQNRKETQQ